MKMIHSSRPALVLAGTLGILAACTTPPGTAPQETATQLPSMIPVEYVGLAGSSWQAIEFQSMDDGQGTSKIKDPAKYTLDFNEDGTASFGLDCNRGSGTWNASDGGRATSGQLSFSVLATTRALCPPPSMGEKLERDSQFMRSYLVRDNMLYLSLMADGGIWVFKPVVR